MVPTTLEDWTLEVVKGLLAVGVYESDSFDFKEQLPHSRNAEDKAGLSAKCAAFANAEGGFLVYGVKDDKALEPGARLVGVDAKDFPNQFGSYPAKCSPSFAWAFKQGGLALASGRVIQVVHIPKSWRAPHSVEPQPGLFRFPKRTNKGTEYMPISEVQQMFLGLQEKKRKLEMLRAELVFLSNVIESIKPVRVEEGETSTITPPMEVLQVLIGETFLLLEQDPILLSSLNEIRRLALTIHECHAEFYRRLSLELPWGAGGDARDRAQLQARNHNAVLQRHCEQMAAAIGTAEVRLRGLAQ